MAFAATIPSAQNPKNHQSQSAVTAPPELSNSKKSGANPPSRLSPKTISSLSKVALTLSSLLAVSLSIAAGYLVFYFCKVYLAPLGLAPKSALLAVAAAVAGAITLLIMTLIILLPLRWIHTSSKKSHIAQDLKSINELLLGVSEATKDAAPEQLTYETLSRPEQLTSEADKFLDADLFAAYAQTMTLNNTLDIYQEYNISNDDYSIPNDDYSIPNDDYLPHALGEIRRFYRNASWGIKNKCINGHAPDLGDILENFKTTINTYQQLCAVFCYKEHEDKIKIQKIARVGLDYLRRQCIELLEQLPELRGYIKEISELIIGPSSYTRGESDKHAHAILKRPINAARLAQAAAQVMGDESNYFIPASTTDDSSTSFNGHHNAREACKDLIIKALKFYYTVLTRNSYATSFSIHMADRSMWTIHLDLIYKKISDPRDQASLEGFQQFIHGIQNKVKEIFTDPKDPQVDKINSLLKKINQACNALKEVSQEQEPSATPSAHDVRSVSNAEEALKNSGQQNVRA